MIYKEYLDKICTICSNSKLNSGINPVAELHYGNGVYSRMLVHFDEKQFKQMVDDKTFGDASKVKYTLNITNAGSIDFTDVHCNKISEITNNRVERATSFDLIFFLIDKEWDGGKGFDMIETKFTIQKGYLDNNIKTQRFLSEDGANWYQPRNGYKWSENGVYSNETLSKEYENFASESGSTIIFARQHFDIGNEDIQLDITEIVNKMINEEIPNYGIGIAFTPMTEITERELEQYSSFFTHKTNTFFEPYVEAHYCNSIMDDRGTFTLNKLNKLYLYCNIGGIATNLDEIPTCSINEINYPVIQQSKGIYYAEIVGDKNVFTPNTMYYDVWSNIKFQGQVFDDVEMDFVVHSTNNFFNFTNGLTESTHVSPIIYGIKEGEEIFRNHDIRKVNIIGQKTYDKKKAIDIHNVWYRIYIMDGTREYTVLAEQANNCINECYFTLYCENLIPQKYHVDITIEYNQEKITYKNLLSFRIVDNLNNKYN